MSQLVIRPAVSLPVGAAVRQLRQHAHEFVATSLAALARIRPRPHERAPRREAAYFEWAEMSREMYRL